MFANQGSLLLGLAPDHWRSSRNRRCMNAKVLSFKVWRLLAVELMVFLASGSAGTKHKDEWNGRRGISLPPRGIPKLEAMLSGQSSTEQETTSMLSQGGNLYL